MERVYNNISSCSFRDCKGNSAVHSAAAAGYTETLETILNIHNFLMDAENKTGVQQNMSLNY